MPSTVEIKKFEQSVRQYLENAAPRLMMVLDPIKLVIENVADDYRVPVQVPLHPKDPSMGTVETSFTKTIYIEREDFREVDSPDYYRLAPGKSVGLFKAPFPVICTSFSKGSDGRVNEIRCKLVDHGSAAKPKAFIMWVNAAEAVPVDEVRYFHPLFNSEPPPADFESDVNPNSLEVFTTAVIEPAFYTLAQKAIGDARKESEERTKKAKEENIGVDPETKGGEDEPVVTAEQLVGMENIRFQAMRLAYFTVDRESTVGCLNEGKAGRREGDKLILNRIVTLKEDVGKKV
jgi:glutaminyl-tRNA synthetase